MIKAIVLSCDTYVNFADHMIAKYQELWPDNPFVFYVPYQKPPFFLKEKYGSKINLIKTDVNFKLTILTLIKNLPDEEWIYWCLDDKYPIELKLNEIRDIYNSIVEEKIEGIDSILFCRCRYLLRDDHLFIEDQRQVNGRTLIRRKNYNQFWIHTFMKVGVLRSLFEELPDRNLTIRELGAFVRQSRNSNLAKQLPSSRRLYVTKDNYAIFGESTRNGKITLNCFYSMYDKAISYPKKYKIYYRNIIMGVLSEGNPNIGKPESSKLPLFFKLKIIEFEIINWIIKKLNYIKRLMQHP